MSNGLSKVRNLLSRLSPPAGVLKFNVGAEAELRGPPQGQYPCSTHVDGAAREKPCPTEICGVLGNSEGEVLAMFSKNVDILNPTRQKYWLY